jgi:hypothetical protein
MPEQEREPEPERVPELEPGQINAALAHVVRQLRVGVEMTSRDVYLAARLTESAYERLEYNDRGFSAEQIRAIARVHGMRGSELLAMAEKAIENGEVPEVPRSVKAWRQLLGFDS